MKFRKNVLTEKMFHVKHYLVACGKAWTKMLFCRQKSEQNQWIGIRKQQRTIRTIKSKKTNDIKAVAWQVSRLDAGIFPEDLHHDRPPPKIFLYQKQT